MIDRNSDMLPQQCSEVGTGLVGAGCLPLQHTWRQTATKSHALIAVGSSVSILPEVHGIYRLPFKHCGDSQLPTGCRQAVLVMGLLIQAPTSMSLHQLQAGLHAGFDLSVEVQLHAINYTAGAGCTAAQ